MSDSVGRRSGRRGWSQNLLLGLGGLGVLVVVYLGVTFVQVWVTADRADVGPVDAVVVLGAAQWDGAPSPVFQRRLDRAVELWQSGAAPRIVVAGGKQDGDRVTQGFAAYDYLRSREVPDEAILVEVEGTDTYGELAAAASILTSEGYGDRVLLVTDGYHALRTQMVADEVGLDPQVSTVSGTGGLGRMVRETAAVSLGRLVGFRRLANWT